MVEALRESGPVFALGNRANAPRLGASRVYVNEAEWQQQVLSWFDGAALRVMHIPASPTDGLVWEIERGLQLVERDRLVFVVTSGAGADWLAQTLAERIPDTLPSLRSRRGPYGSRVSGILHFARGRPEFRRLVKPPIFHRPLWAPLVPVYQLALRDVIARVNGFAQPLRPGFGDALAVAFGIGFVVAVAAARRHTPSSSGTDDRPVSGIVSLRLGDPIGVDRVAERSTRQHLIEASLPPPPSVFKIIPSMGSVRARRGYHHRIAVFPPWRSEHCCIGSGPSRFSSDTRAITPRSPLRCSGTGSRLRSFQCLTSLCRPFPRMASRLEPSASCRRDVAVRLAATAVPARRRDRISNAPRVRSSNGSRQSSSSVA
jgi:hypothetical protein